MAKNWGRNMLKQDLICKNVIKQIDIKYILYIYSVGRVAQSV